MYTEDELLPISALQHFVVCPRQCALIHLESTWLDNARTTEGRLAHQRVDRGGRVERDGIRRAFGIPLRSLAIGLAGRADVVEFHAGASGEVPYPVEHKRGRPKRGDEDLVQLCAQAICLEEMLGSVVPAGALFYGLQRRRLVVAFDDRLRGRVATVAAAVRAMFKSGVTPPAPEGAPCRGCSLAAACLPRETTRSAARWLARRLSEEDP